MNNKGQVGFGGLVGIIMGIVSILVAVILIAAFFPLMQEEFDSLRGQNSLNCESDTNICGGIGSNDSDVCYNSSVYAEHSTSCAIQSVGLPLILIMLIISALGILIGGRAVTGY